MSEEESVMKWGRKPVVSLAAPCIPNTTTKKPARRHLRMRGGSVPVLDPILAQPSSNMSLMSVPEELRHLPPDTMIDIYDRRTCKVMRGDNAIALSDLPSALMEHAEYEPIIPLQPDVK